PHGFPVQNEAIAQELTCFFIGVQRGAEEAAVGAAEFVGQLSQEPQRQDWLARFPGRSLGRIQVGVPEETRGLAISLATDGIERRGQSLPLRVVYNGANESEVPVRFDCFVMRR